ncbi:hypothetical protein B0H14DRAFT_2601824 [Mycena olivaceomarginata]|nr:hypothetical protein B0H14DRAFT_2601824 [Mycena olivaceomarginata]
MGVRASSNDKGKPWHTISAAEFAAMHRAHALAHAPDGVLFPFLHGLEGDNVAQNTFFSSGGAYGEGKGTGAGRRGRRAVVPRFRGLVWVVAEEDLESAPAAAPLLRREDGDEFDEEESDDEEESEEEEDELRMDVDADDGVRIVDAGDQHQHSQQEQDRGEDEDGKHMHPVHHRLQTTGLPLSAPGCSTDDSDVQMEIALPPPSHAGSDSSSGSAYSASASASASSASPDPPSPAALPDTASEAPSPPTAEHELHGETQQEHEGPPLLTCTFRPRELIRRVVGVARKERPPLPRLNGAALHAPNGAVPLPSSSTENEGEKNEEKKSEEEEEEEEWEFRPARVPDGISLRNFGIQVPIYATLSDIVLYSPRGLASGALQELAKRFVGAVERKRKERCKGLDGPDAVAPLEYNVFVLDADARALREAVPELMMRVFPGGERERRWHNGNLIANPALHPHSMEVDGHEKTSPSDAPVAVPIDPDADATRAPNTVDFGQRERDEMRELTRASEILSVFPVCRRDADTAEGDGEREDLATTTTASHWRPLVGQVFLGNSGDVPLGGDGTGGVDGQGHDDPFMYEGTNDPRDGFGYDVCVECHEMAPFPSLAHLRAAEDHLALLEGMWEERVRALGGEGETPVRPPPNATAVIHLPFPSAPANTAQTMNALLPVIAFLERCLRPVPPRSPSHNSSSSVDSATTTPRDTRRWSTFPAVSPASFFPSPPPLPGAPPRMRSLTSPSPSPAPAAPPRSRPLKILIYSSDGYTESSPLALSLLMAVRRLRLPEAYLELQVAKRRSFFVYPGELGLLRRVEARIGGGEVFAPARLGMGRRMSGTGGVGSLPSAGASTGSLGSVGGEGDGECGGRGCGGAEPAYAIFGRATVREDGAVTRAGRPRARTSPWLPSFGDHQSWFNDPRFDGSFPSRVLPFLYLGNLNHASNAYMLHALGITHVVSVGECALVPPPGHCTDTSCTSPACRANHSTNAHFIQGKGPGNQGSLWIEEREGRIKVLDIQGVCDDGIDTLEPQLEPICEWIEKARQEGGQVLVHCRVGVSRSATVTIAYVMKHLSLPLVDAYLIVRSRRLSVLIQPNMRLLYNLCGWEIKLAKERAQGDEQRLKKELARTLTWPYLSKEVHALNEKYLH